ncbi:MAG: diaminopimelate decarboxylase [Acidobacteria bacterium]|nr:MAG: diaminopimelate decarboxylase [Acidobacteriota bacterium]
MTAAISADGHLTIGGCDTVELAREFGTPLYVYDEAHLRDRCGQYRDSFAAEAESARVIFAGKSFCTLAMCRLVAEEGLYLDVASGGELATALAAGFPAERIYFHGNNKSESEICEALVADVGRIVIDSFEELARVAHLAREHGVRPRVLLRITPGIEAHTHEFIRTGQLDSKFGFGVEDGVAARAIKTAAEEPAVELVGVHAHIGSQIFLLHSYAKAVDVMIDFLAETKANLGVDLAELNLGGGLGIAYTADDTPETIAGYASTIVGEARRHAAERGIAEPMVAVEPGRSITGNAAVTLYEVGTIKEVPGIRTYVAVDGGMSDNLRPMLYGAQYEALTANRAHEERTREVTIAGKHCESGDVLIKDARLGAGLAVGDIIATPATGAYGWVMSNNYNAVPRPAVVFVADGRARVVVHRESYDDLLRNQEP